MTGGAFFGLLWAAVAVLLGLRWWAERARWLSTVDTTPPRARRPRFGARAEDGSGRRLRTMLLAYAVGAMFVSAGILTSTPALLGLGALAVNVGTIYRFLVLALDSSRLELPVLPTNRPARHVPQALAGHHTA